MSRIIKIVFFIVFIFAGASCSILKKSTTVSESKPAWVTTKPSSSMYYVGISSALKKGQTPDQYMKSAKDKALADLASNISVNIESSSALSLIETSYNMHQSFNQNINSSTNEYLEGYEQVETWEDNDYYWVYFRLSKSLYNEQKEKKKQQKIVEAKAKYYQAEDLKKQKNHCNALKFYLEALSSIKNYLGENTITDLNGENKDLGTTLVASIAEFVNDINFEMPTSLKIKKSIEINPELLKFRLLDKKGNPIANFPIKFNFSAVGLLKDAETTDNSGFFYCSVKKVKTNSANATLEVSADMTAISRFSNDADIRNIIKNIPAKTDKIYFDVEKPSMKIICDEREFGEPRNSTELANAFSSGLSSDFVISNEENPDYTMLVNTETSKSGNYYNEIQVTINYSINIINKNGTSVYHKSNSSEASAINASLASKNAYLDFSKTIERTLCRDIKNSIN